MRNTNIEWCHHTVNFWWGCVKVSLACLHCYAETLAKLFSRGKASWGSNGLRWIRTVAALRELRKLDKDARKRGVVERVFINSMSDTFEDRRDLDEARDALFFFGAGLTNLQLLLLTKRPENIRRMVPPSWLEPGGWPARFWIGTTVENQATANERIPILLDVPARVRFLSMEPLLGPVDLRRIELPGYQESLATYNCLNGNYRADGMNEPAGGGQTVHWVIVGGESGAGARPIYPLWAADLRDQCARADVPYFFKQWGEFLPADLALARQLPGAHEYVRAHEGCQAIPQLMFRVGKKAAGRELDGQLHDAVPAP